LKSTIVRVGTEFYVTNVTTTHEITQVRYNTHDSVLRTHHFISYRTTHCAYRMVIIPAVLDIRTAS